MHSCYFLQMNHHFQRQDQINFRQVHSQASYLTPYVNYPNLSKNTSWLYLYFSHLSKEQLKSMKDEVISFVEQ